MKSIAAGQAQRRPQTSMAQRGFELDSRYRETGPQLTLSLPLHRS